MDHWSTIYKDGISLQAVFPGIDTGRNANIPEVWTKLQGFMLLMEAQTKSPALSHADFSLPFQL